MPMQVQQQWREYLSCHVCYSLFDETLHQPISLLCTHTVCKACLIKFNQKKCPIDQTVINHNVDELPVNYALLQLVGVVPPSHVEAAVKDTLGDQTDLYLDVRKNLEELALFLKPSHLGGVPPTISLPMQRKLITVVTCQLMDEEGRIKVVRAARSLGERAVTELLLLHQNPQQLAPNLWTAVRTRGCQFLGPAMQEEVLKLILLAQEEGQPLSRKVLVLFVVQRLEPHYPQASKTAIGHVVQLLYRASCFKVMKRDEESSLMQLKEEFRTYEALRREHDAQIVQIALEAGLRITPEQWSSFLYNDNAHKSHMQSIIDKLQTSQSFSQSVSELMMALQRSGDPTSLSALQPHLELLTNIDPSHDVRTVPTWESLKQVTSAVVQVIRGFDEFAQQCSARRHEALTAHSSKYKTSLCRDLQVKGKCPRGNTCSFAHSQEELERFRTRNKKLFGPHTVHMAANRAPTSSALTPQETAELVAIRKATQEKLRIRGHDSDPQLQIFGGSSGDLSSTGRLPLPRNSRFDITAVSEHEGQRSLGDSFQQQQLFAQRALRQGQRCPSGGELTQYYQTSMQGIGEQQLYGSDFMHGIYGRGADYTEPVGGYATWHPHGSSAPRRALTDLFPTLASSTVQSQSADRVHGGSSLHLSDMLWHPMDKLPEAQDMSPVKSEDLTSFDSGWNIPSSGSHASFFTGSERKRSVSPQHDNISDDSGLDLDRHYHTWSSEESHAQRPSILPKDRMGPLFHGTSSASADTSKLRDFVPWEECGTGRFGPISRYAKSDKLISSPIMEAVAVTSSGGFLPTSRAAGHVQSLSANGRLLAGGGGAANVYQSANCTEAQAWPSSLSRLDNGTSSTRNAYTQQQQPVVSFADQLQNFLIPEAQFSVASVTPHLPDHHPRITEFGGYGYPQHVAQSTDKHHAAMFPAAQGLFSLHTQSLMNHPQSDFKTIH